MSKSELIAAVADTGVTISAIVETTAGDDEVSIAGFGKFDLRENAARKGRNPATGEEMDIAASKAQRGRGWGGF